MAWIERSAVAATIVVGVAVFCWVLWRKRLGHVWLKRGEIRVVCPTGLWSGLWEVFSQRIVIANRPWVGAVHLALLYGFLAFAAKSIAHVSLGLGATIALPLWYERSVDVIAALVLAAVLFMAVRRYAFERHKLTHMLESGVVLSLIAMLMITTLSENLSSFESTSGRVNWWMHSMALVSFPAVIANGKHLHLLMAPINVVLKHMTERPGDRRVFGGDFDPNIDEELQELQYARLGMPKGVADFSFQALFDGAACIECGRCNDACPAGPNLKPREHFVLSLRDPRRDAAHLAAIVPAEIAATCVQCRACDTACPTGCRPALSGLEIRGRLTFEGLYPPHAVTTHAARTVAATGNIFGLPAEERARFIKDSGFPLYEPADHDVLLVLGCQGGNSPEVQPVILATARLLEAAEVSFGVLAEERCFGEGLLHGGGLMQTWPDWWPQRSRELTEALHGDRSRTILTICPHCRDTLQTQYAAVGTMFQDVQLHIPFLARLLREGRLKLRADPMDAALHTPCKVLHNGEQGTLESLLEQAGVRVHKPASSADNFPTQCCGGGGNGYLWDSPARVNTKRWAQIEATGQKRVVTGCPGCHRMLGIMKSEDAMVVDIATVLADRLEVDH